MHEAPFAIRIIAPPAPALHRAIEAIAGAYRQRFYQHALGLLVTPICASF